MTREVIHEFLWGKVENQTKQTWKETDLEKFQWTEWIPLQ